MWKQTYIQKIVFHVHHDLDLVKPFRQMNELRADECGVIRSILIGDVVALLCCQSIEASAKYSSAIDWSKTYSSNPSATLSVEFFLFP